MAHALSERQQVQLVLRATSPAGAKSALDAPVPPVSYLAWSTARRRAWDRRHAAPNAYFFHYLHPSFAPRPPAWPVPEHRAFLAALRRAPPPHHWGLFSLLVPGRVGTDCRRYYHRIGRAGFITVDGKVRNRLVAKATVADGKRVLRSANPLFLRRSLRKFVPDNLPQIDDSLYKSVEKLRKKSSDSGPSTHHPGKRKRLGNGRDAKPPRSSPSNSNCSGKLSSGTPAPCISLEDAQDLLTYVPAVPSEHDDRLSLERDPHKENLVPAENEVTSESVLCRLQIRDFSEKKNPRSGSSSISVKICSRSKTKISSHPTSGRARGGPAKTGSVAVKLRTKPPKPASSSERASQLAVRAGPKRKVPNRAPKAQKCSKTSKNDNKAEKQNQIHDLTKSSRASRGVTADQIPQNANAAERANVLPDARKQADTGVGKESDVVGLPPPLDCGPPLSEVTDLKQRSVKPLKPILKPQDSSKERRETGKSVHFSSKEGQEKESPAQKDVAPGGDGIQGKINPNIDGDFFPKGDRVHNQAENDPKKVSKTDPRISKAGDSSRCMQNRFASGNAHVASCDSAITSNANKPQANVEAGVRVSPIFPKGYGGYFSAVETVLEDNASSTSSDECKHLPQTPDSSKITEDPHLGCADRPLGAAVGVCSNSGQLSGSMSSTRKTTPEQLHVGSFSEGSEKRSFEDKSQNRVETVQTEQATSGTKSQSTGGTDGEFLDMEVGMDPPPGNRTALFEDLEKGGEPGTALRNSRRITGPTREDRTSIGFLMNEYDTEPHPKKRRVGTDETFVGNAVCGRFERVVSLTDAECGVILRTEEGEECRDSQELLSVENSAYPKIRSEYQLMQTRIEQTRLMLSLFVDMVDPIGEQLGHKHQRRKLLASFDETFQRLQATEGHAAKKIPLPFSSLLRAANTAVLLDNRNVGKQSTVHLGGLTHYWGTFVDSYIGRVKDMEKGQKLEAESRRIADSFC